MCFSVVIEEFYGFFCFWWKIDICGLTAWDLEFFLVQWMDFGWTVELLKNSVSFWAFSWPESLVCINIKLLIHLCHKLSVRMFSLWCLACDCIWFHLKSYGGIWTLNFYFQFFLARHFRILQEVEADALLCNKSEQ